MAITSEVSALFEDFASRYEALTELREKVIQKSRNVTRKSKAVISLLHRGSKSNTGLQGTSIAKAWDSLDAVGQDLSELHALLSNQQDFYRLHRSFSGALQEFVEAASFLTFLDKGTFLTYEGILERSKFPIPIEDFLLGIDDLGGELMRHGTNQAGMGRKEEVEKTVNFLSRLYTCMSNLNFNHREHEKKLGALRESLRKVEHVSYMLKLRAAEGRNSFLFMETQADNSCINEQL